QLDTVGNNPSSRIGLVMVRPNNNTQWGYICDDFWNQGAAKVVCKQLFGNVTIADPGLRIQYKPVVANPPNFALDDVSCAGTEATLWDCIPNLNNSWNQNNCNGNELAGVTCAIVPDPTAAGPSPQLLCNNNNMQLVYPVPWTVLPTNNQTLAVLNNVNYLTMSYASPSTSIVQDANNITYSMKVVMTYPSYGTGVALYRRYNATLACTLPRRATVQKTFLPQASITLGNQTTIGMQMIIYQNRSFQNPVTNYPYVLPMGAWMDMAVVMNTSDSRLKVVVTYCLAAPGMNPTIGQNFVFYNNKCLIRPNISATYPLANNRFGFRLQSFVFSGFNVVQLRCNAIVCLQNDTTQECDRSCSSAKPIGRRRRDTLETSNTDRTVYTIDSPWIHITNLTTTGGTTAPMRNAATASWMPPATANSFNTHLVPALQKNQADQPEHSHRLVMTLGNAASLPSAINILVPLIATLIALGLMCGE
ncbi:ZP domain-containing protein-like, partial [Littorina saxatilis]|uniref:ZP domain-containing protein-like n=1 Tax=Littorina saxatilis TaxID=31220 RepID=UPI0038B493DF